MFFLKCHCL
ncbi:hypothetical protein LINPERPRIM_LOCUS25622 [Linum perenne]